jgi:two-component system sensor histidine kinase/response regulator
MCPAVGETEAKFLKLSFPREVERSFHSDYFRKSIQHVRVALLFFICFYGLFGILDGWLFPDIDGRLWSLCYGVFFPFALGVYVFSYSRHFEKYMQAFLSAVVLMAGCGIGFMVLFNPSPANHLYYASLILVSMCGYTFFRLGLTWGSFAGFTIAIVYEMGLIFFGKPPASVLINNSFFLVATNIFGMCACYSIELNQRRDFMHANLLEAKRHKSDAATQNLEKRIEERTQQLLRSNEKLKTEVMERKRGEDEIRRYNANLEQMVAKRTEDLARSEERYRTILDNVTDGYYEVDIAGNLTFFNDALCEIYGYPREELMGMNNRRFCDKENAAKVYREFNRVYTTAIPTKRIDWEMTTKDGSKRQVETSVSLIKDHDDRTTGFRGIVRDVTERKALEDELREKSRLAEEASKAKSEFLANMSHEIRTPLNGIIGMAELAMDTGLDDSQKNIFHAINTEATTLFALINHILDFSKIEAGKLELERIPFDVRVVVEDVANSIAISAEQKGLEFICFLSPEIPTRLIGDPSRLRQVLVNLAGNAVKFTHQGEIYIKGEVIQESKDDITLLFSVKDTGIGIPKKDQMKIFESFTQYDGSTTRKYGGTGLGTTISKQLVEMMGGEIGLDSEEGKGSTFWFKLPFERHPVEKGTGPARDDVELSDLKVMVVDDNRTNRFIQMEYLRSWGCLPLEAASAKEALTILNEAASSQNPFNLILTDVHMPEMDGFDLARELKKMEAFSGTPIIAFTSAGSNGDDKKCREIGIDGYLTKPIRRDEMHKAIVSVLGLYKEAGEEPVPKLVTMHTIAEGNAEKGKILLAEDYPTNQQVAMRFLQSAGYDVDLAENGREALEAFTRKSYDLILMDIQMPVMEGYEATRAIRAIEERHSQKLRGQETDSFKRVPIVAMTAHAMKSDRDKCFAAGMDDYIAKPLRRKELLEMVSGWIGRRRETTDPLRPARPVETNEKNGFPLDFQKAMDEFEGDRDFLMEVLEGFLGQASDQIGAIQQALSTGNTEAVWREAHAIKGGASNLTADALAGAALELEKAGRVGSTDAIEIFDRLKKEYGRLKAYSMQIR